MVGRRSKPVKRPASYASIQIPESTINQQSACRNLDGSQDRMCHAENGATGRELILREEKISEKKTPLNWRRASRQRAAVTACSFRRRAVFPFAAAPARKMSGVVPHAGPRPTNQTGDPMARRCWKHSRQYTGLPWVGLKGTVVSFPHCEQVVRVSAR